jgi:chromosome segregation ATPase
MIEDERDRARAELAEVRAELAKAKATIEKQAEEINDLENREDILRINLADRDKARAELAEAKEVISRIRAVINEGGSAMSEYYMVVEIDGILAGCEEA